MLYQCTDSIANRFGYVDITILYPTDASHDTRFEISKTFACRYHSNASFGARGEDTFITPYQQLANYTVNTFLPYETFAYGTIFQQMPEAMKIAQQIPELAAMLQVTIPFSLDWIPETALIREFIGGSVYYNK